MLQLAWKYAVPIVEICGVDFLIILLIISLLGFIGGLCNRSPEKKTKPYTVDKHYEYFLEQQQQQLAEERQVLLQRKNQMEQFHKCPSAVSSKMRRMLQLRQQQFENDLRTIKILEQKLMASRKQYQLEQSETALWKWLKQTEWEQRRREERLAEINTKW